jgi:uncharacterized protein YegL
MAQNTSVGIPYTFVNDGLRALFAELSMTSMGGAKPYFKASIIRFGDRPKVLAEARAPVDLDADMDKIATFDGSSGTTDMAGALDEAARVIKRHPGNASDFEPWVFLFSDGYPNDAASAQAAASRLKSVSVAAGQPKLMTLGFGDADDALMTSLASGPEWYRRLANAAAIERILPAIGTVATSTQAPSPSLVTQQDI